MDLFTGLINIVLEKKDNEWLDRLKINKLAQMHAQASHKTQIKTGLRPRPNADVSHL